jgi:hypothetical protein
MKAVQQLVFDGKNLSCPAHPDHPLETGATVSDRGTFSQVCMAATSGNGVCMNSAEWENEDAMHAELKRLALETEG